MPSGALVILGCGWIALRHATAARALRIPLVFASRDLARARAYARRFRAIAAYGDYAEALRDPRVSGAVVCTPHDRHLPDVLAALAAGRHVLVEKPIARTLGEADAMIAAAAAAECVLMVAEQFHFMPAFRYVRRLLDGDRLGELRQIHMRARGFHRPMGWRLAGPAAGGGALIDGGIHYVHSLRWWGGSIDQVFALAPAAVQSGLGGEEAVDLLARLPGGAVGLLSNSLGAPGIPRFQWSTVTGTRASCLAENRGRVVAVRGGGRGRLRIFRRDTRGYEAMLKTFREAMESGRAPEMDGAAGRADLAVVLAAYRSIAEGRPVDLAC
ncbi:MAG: Gfo/Idh/MocA family oxidoreductase [Candidatus Rokubacteria bacterium]|nr:Gfo/Idh/MocA family oxidoreductase [Candidatus Rokubacteria bacterium]